MKNKKGSSIFTIILEVVIVLAIIGIGFAIYFTITEDSIVRVEEEQEVNNVNNNTKNNTSATTTNSGNSESKNEDKNKTKVSLDGYTFKISEDKYAHTKDEKGLVVDDKNGKFSVQFFIEDLAFDNLENDKTALANSLGLTYASELEIIEKRVDNINYKCLEIDLFGMKYIIAYSKLSDNKSLITTVMNESYTIDYEALEEITEVVKTVEKSN